MEDANKTHRRFFMKTPFRNLLFVFAAAVLAGCAHMPSGMSPSTRPVSLNAKVIGYASGQSMYVSLLGVLPLGTPDYAAAVSDALRKVPGATAMVNVGSYSTFLHLGVISIHTLTVEGDIVKE